MKENEDRVWLKDLPKIEGRSGKGRRIKPETQALLDECKRHKGEYTLWKSGVSKSYAPALQSSKRFPGYKFITRTVEGVRNCYVSWEGEIAALADLKTCKHQSLHVPAGKIQVCPDCREDVKGPFNLRAILAEKLAVPTVG